MQVCSRCSKIRALVALSVASLAVVGSPNEGRATDRAHRPPMRVLFIGNSYTRFNDLPRMVARVSESARRGPVVRTQRETRAGFDLPRHWRRSRVRARVGSGRFHSVVIQGHSLAALDHPDQLADYARRFSERAASAGARVILFQTWARHGENRFYQGNDPASPEDMVTRVDAVYRRVSRDLDVAVAPVGNAWARASHELPEIQLHRGDRGTHPDIAGTYLSACVLYGTLTGIDPRETSWRPSPISRAQAARIRAVAAASL